MSDNTIPEYLQPALAQLEKARAGKKCAGAGRRK